jgi:hypothetical protein
MVYRLKAKRPTAVYKKMVPPPVCAEEKFCPYAGEGVGALGLQGPGLWAEP